MNKNIITVAKFAARLGAIFVDGYKSKIWAAGKFVALLPQVPGLLNALPAITKEWGAMGDDAAWRDVVAAVKQDFDLKNDIEEAAIEAMIDAGLEILLKIKSVVEAVVAILKRK